MDTWQLPVSVALLVFVSSYFKLFSNVLAGFILGIFVTSLNYILFYQLSWKSLVVDKPIKIDAKVSQIIKAGDRPYIQVKINKLDQLKVKSWQTVHANLSIVEGESAIKVGDTISGTATLKPFYSRKNQYAFDSELYAFRNHIFFKGKLKVDSVARHHGSWRLQYQLFMLDVFDGYQFGWLYYVLMTGDKSKIPKSDKAHFRTLGLSHLLAISGLHIAILFSLSLLLIKVCLFPFKSFLGQTVNTHSIGLICALGCAGLYVVMSGMQISAQRAWFMACAGVLCYLLGTRLSFIRLLIYTLTIVTMVSPFALLNLGLYFSFTAVAGIFWLLSKRKAYQYEFSSWLNKCVWLCKVQVVLFIVLCPLVVYVFHGLSVSGLLINLIFVPLLSIVIFPLLLVQIVLHSVSESNAIMLLDNWLFNSYHFLISFDFHWFDVQPISTSQLCLMMLSFILLAHVLTRIYALIPLSLLLVHWLLSPKPSWQINVFDVGHGSAVLISQDNKAVLYDLGANYFGTYSMFKHVVLPYIKARNLKLVHTIVSHDDGDHAGGLMDLYKLGFGESLNTFHRATYAQPCLLQDVILGDLTIRSIWPKTLQNNDNNSSCVVVVSDDRFKLLLPGDIEADVEAKIISKYRNDLKANFLLAPHHGSRTSSTKQFIKAVEGELVIFSRSRNTAWQLPHTEVLQRYRDAGYETYDTALDGEVQIRVFNEHFEVYTARNAKNLWFLR
ncbi:DNA internalization-related competence protein ComEC/Rec2 [Pseudoalteromonas luteoviolacea]|uniref:Putative hydrolase, metallo-beta-lactamase superfamily n=1 Tax=Pseudoalteromonas luteoviolacea TaxID=43657 RepID=A0A023PZJ8_9GAMM|nr:DNA internalization-related competence protein ComEC/Rec2 [Pseudoalteromonas luteoviolacea]AHX39633.1 putative hydrolase, metallo-beta-lactamase superfamily [Pseudoalteromonas luteoviolacea]